METFGLKNTNRADGLGLPSRIHSGSSLAGDGYRSSRWHNATSISLAARKASRAGVRPVPVPETEGLGARAYELRIILSP